MQNKTNVSVHVSQSSTPTCETFLTTMWVCGPIFRDRLTTASPPLLLMSGVFSNLHAWPRYPSPLGWWCQGWKKKHKQQRALRLMALCLFWHAAENHMSVSTAAWGIVREKNIFFRHPTVLKKKRYCLFLILFSGNLLFVRNTDLPWIKLGNEGKRQKTFVLQRKFHPQKQQSGGFGLLTPPSSILVRWVSAQIRTSNFLRTTHSNSGGKVNWVADVADVFMWSIAHHYSAIIAPTTCGRNLQKPL